MGVGKRSLYVGSFVGSTLGLEEGALVGLNVGVPNALEGIGVGAKNL